MAGLTSVGAAGVGGGAAAAVIFNTPPTEKFNKAKIFAVTFDVTVTVVTGKFAEMAP